MKNDKIYEYNGKYYGEIDHSLDFDDGLWGGDLYDLYWDASHDDMKGVLCEHTAYYNAYNPEVTYESAEELVEATFENCVVVENCVVGLDDIRKNTDFFIGGQK